MALNLKVYKMLEQIYPLKLIERHNGFAFLLGFAYSIIGIGAAVLLFPEDPAIVAVAFIAIMFLPTLNSLVKEEEEIESKKEEFNLFVFLKDHKEIFLIYILFFLGTLLAFSFFALTLNSLATNHIFENQINVLYGSATGRAFDTGLFKSIFANNLMVLILCFIAAFIFGDGAIFLIVWNASVWGTIFGTFARNYALAFSKNPFTSFLIVLAIVFVHMILEAFAYISAASAGGVISKGILREKFFSERFRYIIGNTIITLVFAVIILVIAVLAESYVLGNIGFYQKIVSYSFI